MASEYGLPSPASGWSELAKAILRVKVCQRVSSSVPQASGAWQSVLTPGLRAWQNTSAWGVEAQAGPGTASAQVCADWRHSLQPKMM